MMTFPEKGLPRLRQITPDTHQEPQTSSGISIPTTAFTVNQNNAVCLPLLSESQKLVWVHSHQIDLQLEGAAELEKAFDRFPYLTNSQTSALAQRCSLHPDQVKVWFMAQRLRYGISWDHKDVLKIQKQVMSSQSGAQGNTELQNNTSGEVKKRGRKKKQRTVEETQGITNDEGMMGGDVSVKEEKTNQQMNKETAPKFEESNAPKKRGRKPKMDRMMSKKMKQDNEDVMESERLKTQPESEQPHTPLDSSSLLIFKSERQTLNSSSLTDPDLLKKNEDVCSISACQLGGGLKAEETSSPHFVTDIAKLKEVMEGSSTPVASALAQQQHYPVIHFLTTRPSTKSHSQLLLMKIAFSHCQYPDSEQYDHLAVLTGLSRRSLVQWFADMRYIIKKRKPRWMTEEQYKQAVDNIKYQQYKNTQ